MGVSGFGGRIFSESAWDARMLCSFLSFMIIGFPLPQDFMPESPLNPLMALKNIFGSFALLK